MWEYNRLENKWVSKKDRLIYDNYEFLKQEQESFRFYSNCLSGATYLPFNDNNNIYDILTKNNSKTWYIDPNVSNYVNTIVPPSFPSPINRDNAYDFYTKNLSEYNLTLKNLFTPEKVIKDSFDNFIYVDLATTDEILDLNENLLDSKIDNTRVLNGHKILVKNQKERVILPITIDPDEYFQGNYTVIETIGVNTTYEYFDETNGIYIVQNGNLIKENDLDDYYKCVRYSVSVKLGETNKNKQFHLSRLLNGYYPTTKFNEPIEFIEKENNILRNIIDYNNIGDLNYYDIIKHGIQSYNFNSIDYTIPQRIITVGEFGSIINNQDGYSNIIRNKYKSNLKSITDTTIYYWAVGDKGNLLRIRKHDFDIKNIELIDSNKQILNNLNSISFTNDLNGVLVGDNNTIFITSNGGKSWERFNVKAFESFNFNKVIFYNINLIYIIGDNGVFLELKNENNKWVAYKRRISKFIDGDDELLLVDNINDMIISTFDNWTLNYTYFDNRVTEVMKEVIIMVTNDSNIIIHDINDSIPFETEFIFLEFKDKNYGDIINIQRKSNSNTIFFTGFDESQDNNGIFSFDLDNFISIGIDNSTSNTILSNIEANYISELYPNKIYDYNSEDLWITGNNSLLKKYIYTNSNYNFENIDETFLDKLKSKLLFLDYDIASKLNFFTDQGEYRLPNSVVINYDDIDDDIEFYSKNNELSWLDYWKDSLSTFEFYTQTPMTESTKVEFSTKFKFTTKSLLKEVEIVSNKKQDIINLAPNLYNNDYSRFSSIDQVSITQPLDSTIEMFLDNYLMIIKYNSSENIPNKGDVLNIKTDFIETNLIVNKKVVLNNFTYVYMYTEFNQNINSEISIIDGVKITNLNYFNSEYTLVDNLNKHPISKGYEFILTEINDNIEFKPKFNNLTSYYNMALSIKYGNSSIISNIEYEDSFIKFGYTPTYNILDYLEGINEINSNNPIFFPTKEYLSMPVYLSIPVSFNDGNSVYIDYNIKNNNKLIFGKNLKFEWESTLINTFIDLNLYENNQSSKTEQLLVIDKYYDDINETYIIEFHKKINYPNNNQVNPLTEIDIISRRDLKDISDDLQLLNNIQRSYSTKKYRSGTFDSNQTWDVEYGILNKKLNFKINTDSYAKILLSDYDTNDAISGVLYTDFKNEFALNITKLEEKISIPILNTSEFQNKLYISCSKKHGLVNNQGVVLEFNGGIGSSEVLNPQYFGYRIVRIVSEYDFYTDINYGLTPTVGTDTGTVKYIKNDPFLNYQPTDLINVGVDKIGKASIELTPKNTLLSENKYYLNDVNYNKFRFRLVDGLNISSLAINYPWVYESEISDGVIGVDNNGLVWYKGRWDCGRWFGGTWISGTWNSGDWFGGTWKSKNIKDNFINVEINEILDNSSNSIWNNGRWFGGTWENGTWYKGRWYEGVWENGQWYDGLWNSGTWNNGNFTSGIWIEGTWNNGNFSTENGPSYWLSGNWNGGDFDNGMWFNGIFDSKNGIESRFGVKSYNSRSSIWKGGKFINGSFHSRLNIDKENNYDVSDIHKYSIWETGTWFNGDFYGGVVYNMDFKSGTWFGGIVEDINISNINSDNNYITVDGNYNYNIGDEITIIGEKNTNTNNVLGDNEIPGIFKVINTIEKENTTDVYLNTNIQQNINTQDVNYKLVSRFRNAQWESGLWFNGLFEDGQWNGGLWYGGVFMAEWS